MRLLSNLHFLINCIETFFCLISWVIIWIQVFKRLYENTTSQAHVLVHLGILESIRDVCKRVVKELTSWVIENILPNIQDTCRWYSTAIIPIETLNGLCKTLNLLFKGSSILCFVRIITELGWMPPNVLLFSGCLLWWGSEVQPGNYCRSYQIWANKSDWL